MATFTLTEQSVFPNGEAVSRGTITMSSSYTTGGETSPTAANLSLNSISGNLLLFPSAGYVPEYTSSKVKVRHMASGNEASNGTDLSAVSFPLLAFGEADTSA